MAYTAKEYQGGAAATTLSADITAGATTFSAVAATAYPTGSAGNFVIVLDRGKSTEEKILCSSRTTNTFTVATSGRGYDNTTAVGHTAGAALEHVLTAIDLQEANTAVVNTVGRVTTKGDVITGTGPNAFGRTAAGADGTWLQFDSTQAAGVKGAGGIDATAANITPASVTQVQAAGAIGKAADSGHSHAGPGFGGNGAATTVARSDHTHAAGTLNESDGLVATSETTTSTAYVDLTTPGPAVTVTIGASGKAVVIVSAQMNTTTASSQVFMGVAVSGATTRAAADATALVSQMDAGSSLAGVVQGSAVYVFTGLAAGSTTFSAKYRVGSGTGTFSNRQLVVLPV